MQLEGSTYEQALTASELLARALALAVKYHHGATRGESCPGIPALPYVVHPYRVAELLRTLGNVNDPEVLAAALLHDVIEDSGARFDEVARACGERVARIVAELTNDSRLPQSDRHEDMFRRLQEASWEARVIKLADRLDNLRSYHCKPDGNPERFFRQTHRLLEILKGTCPPLEEALRRCLAEAEARYAPTS